MGNETLDAIIAKTLREQSGEYMWTIMNSGSLSPLSKGHEDVHDPEFLCMTERFVQRSRPAVAMSVSRYILRRIFSMFRAMVAGSKPAKENAEAGQEAWRV